MTGDLRIYRGDYVARGYARAGLALPIPLGATVSIVRHFARRRVMVEYQGRTYLTMLWCLKRLPEEATHA